MNDDDRDDLIDGVGFADPHGRSALRAATTRNPRTLPCPSCHAPDCLTPLDRARGYQCDGCADAAERGQDRGCVMGDDCRLCEQEADAFEQFEGSRPDTKEDKP